MPLPCAPAQICVSRVHKTKLHLLQPCCSQRVILATETEILHLISKPPSFQGLFPLDLVFLSHSFPAPFGQLNTNLIFVTPPWLTQGHLLPPEAPFTESSRSFRPHICVSYYSLPSVLALWAMTKCVKRLTHRLCNIDFCLFGWDFGGALRVGLTGS